MLYFTKVRWLSSGKVLKRFFELRAEVKAFMEKNGMAISVLSDPEWLMDLAFDITQTSLDNLREMPPTSPELYRMFKQSMCIFGTTNLCKKTLLHNEIKSKFRSKLTDKHLKAILSISVASSLKPNVAQLCKRKRCQVQKPQSAAVCCSQLTEERCS